MCVFIVSFEYIRCKNITFAKKLGHFKAVFSYFKAVFLTVKQDEILIKKPFVFSYRHLRRSEPRGCRRGLWPGQDCCERSLILERWWMSGGACWGGCCLWARGSLMAGLW